MTKEERDEQIYDWIEILTCDTFEPTGMRGKILKKGINWREWLLPEEQKKYDALSEVEQLSVSIAVDSINALNER